MPEPWTPGPWTLDQREDGRVFVLDAEGLELGAVVWFGSVVTPDARLIAAAPEMAALLAQAADRMAGMDDALEQEFSVGEWTPEPLIAEVRALLARVRGTDV